MEIVFNLDPDTPTPTSIPVFRGSIDGVDQDVCLASDLHLFLGIEEPYPLWIKDCTSSFGFREGKTHSTLYDKDTPTPQVGDCLLSLHTAKHFAILAPTPKGKDYRKYLMSVAEKLKPGVFPHLKFV